MTAMVDGEIGSDAAGRGPTYARFSDMAVACTVSIVENVSVDVDEVGEPVGIRFANGDVQLTEVMFNRLGHVFPNRPEFRDRNWWKTLLP